MRTKKKQIVFRLANSDARIIDFLAKERFMKKSPFFNYCVTQFVNDLFNNGNFSDRNFVRNKQTLISNYSSSTYSSKYYCKLSEGNTKALNWLARNNIFYSSLKFKDIVAFAITQQIKKVDYIKNLNIEDILVSS